jgi:hypothetical protein
MAMPPRPDLDPRSDWFLGWAGRLQLRVPRADWPDIDDLVFWDVYRAAFGRHGIHEPLADAASLLLAEAPPKYLDQQLGAILGHARAILARTQAPGTFRRPEPVDPSWDAAATAHWDSLSDDDRALWIDFVRDRRPALKALPVFLKAQAICWAFEPWSVPDLPPA